MVTNRLFQNVDQDNEQRLLESLVTESIQIHGFDVVYVARTMQNFDQLYGADDSSLYEDTFLIEMYLENILGFGGDREFMSKFVGAEIRDQVIFSMSRRRFTEDIGDAISSSRPREGDLIYFPQNKKVFQIKYVNQYEMFYQLGALYTWQMTCELFEYSGETFNTGIPDIDRISKVGSINILDYTLRDVDGIPLKTVEGDYLVVDGYDLSRIAPQADNAVLETEATANNLIDWSEINPFNEDLPERNREVI